MIRTRTFFLRLAPRDAVVVAAEPEVFFAFDATCRDVKIELGGDTITMQQAIARSCGLF
jgi:hypothetical protein